MQGEIINITRFCTDDGPGIRTTVFLKGCPLKCAWCHNPESQRSGAECYSNGEKIGRTATVQEILDEVLSDQVFYGFSGGGVTVSGGEPLFQAEFTAEILRLCKENGIHTAIETSGYAAAGKLELVSKYCDLVLFDIKETDPQKHLLYTGVPLAPVLANLKLLDDLQKPHIIRLPIIPGVNDRKEHFDEIKKLKKASKYCTDLHIMPYHRLGEYKYELLGRTYAFPVLAEPDKAQVSSWKAYLLDGSESFCLDS